MRAIGALLRKDLRLELRTRESVPAMVLFSLGTFVLFHFALQRDDVDGELAAGILWVTLLFASLLGIGRLFVAEREEGGFDGFLLAPVDSPVLFVAKALLLFAFLAAVEVLVVAAFAILLLGPSPWGAVPGLIVVLLLADAGLAVIGTLVGALAIRTRARDLLVPLLAADGAGPLEARWLLILGLYDLVFGLLAYAIFDFLLEE